MSVSEEKETLVPDEVQTVSALSRTATARKALWRTERFIVWPRYAKVLATCMMLSFVWFAIEVVWPLAPVPHLTGVQITTAGNAVKPADTGAPLDPASFEQSFAERKLFVPEVPVESHELSRKAVDEQVSKMKLTAIIDQGGELTAWVEVSGLAKSDSSSPRSSPAGVAPSETRCVKKGDFLGDFKVVNITASRVDLKIAGFDAHLSY
jgi:hypothetical protein